MFNCSLDVVRLFLYILKYFYTTYFVDTVNFFFLFGSLKFFPKHQMPHFCKFSIWKSVYIVYAIDQDRLKTFSRKFLYQTNGVECRGH